MEKHRYIYKLTNHEKFCRIIIVAMFILNIHLIFLMVKEMCEEPRRFVSRWWRIIIVRGYPRNVSWDNKLT